MGSELKSYYYANGSVSSLSQRLLSNEKILRIIESKNLADGMKVLTEVNYGDTNSNDPLNFEIMLEKEWKDTVKFVNDVSAETSSTDCFILYADYINAKILMKDKYLRKEIHEFLSETGTLDVGTMIAGIEKDEYSSLPKEMADACEKIDKLFFEGQRYPAIIDLALDKAYYLQILRLLKKSKSSEVKEWFEKEIDGKNILSFFRIKKSKLDKKKFDELFLTGGKISKEVFDTSFRLNPIAHLFNKEWQSVIEKAEQEISKESPLTETEKLVDNIKRNIIVSHKNDVEGILPLVNYLLAKKTEIESIRLILVCLKNEVSKDKIILRLRELYV